MSVTALEGEKHLQESMKLEAEGYYELFQIRLKPRGFPEQYLFLTGRKEVDWQGKHWELIPCTLTGYGQQSSGEQTRPKFTVVNPGGLFSKYVHQGWTDNAEVTRYRVLRSHLEANINSYDKHVWRISKPLAVSNATVTFELRGAMDGQMFYLPARAFFPPEFPHVSL